MNGYGLDEEEDEGRRKDVKAENVITRFVVIIWFLRF
jgi:hypothetical protein